MTFVLGVMQASHATIFDNFASQLFIAPGIKRVVSEGFEHEVLVAIL